MQRSLLARLPFALAATLWLGLIATGWMTLAEYAAEPAPLHAAARSWPAGSALTTGSDSLTLVMAVHPHCPCSRASLRMLERLVAQSSQPVRVAVAAYLPSAEDATWIEGPLITQARRLPNAAVYPDPDGREAEQFEVVTSGHTLLYDADGRLLFSGGITAGRGHEGSNAGQTALADRLEGLTHAFYEAPVYGCFIRPI